jgi:hypothetical protein
MSVAVQWSSDSAFNLQLGQDEAQHWIEEVCQEKFKGNFQQSLKDGRLLCKYVAIDSFPNVNPTNLYCLKIN